MQHTARILHTNGAVTTKTITTAELSGAGLTRDGLMPACSALRKDDPTVAAVRVAVPGFADYEWVGNYTQEHMSAVVAREHAGTSNW